MPGCFRDLPAAWWRNFRKESMVNMLYMGGSMECLARVIEGDETAAAPRIAAYLKQFPSARGVPADATEEAFNRSVKEVTGIWPIVAIRPRSTASGYS